MDICLHDQMGHTATLKRARIKCELVWPHTALTTLALISLRNVLPALMLQTAGTVTEDDDRLCMFTQAHITPL